MSSYSPNLDWNNHHEISSRPDGGFLRPVLPVSSPNPSGFISTTGHPGLRVMSEGYNSNAALHLGPGFEV